MIGEKIRFWQPAPGSQEFSCAYVDDGCAALHVHEEWQFAVSAEPASITLGAFRRYAAQSDELTIIQPYDVHTEGGLFGNPRSWLVLHVAAEAVKRARPEGEVAIPRFDCPVVRDPEGSRELAELLGRSMDGSFQGADFTDRVLEWLRHLLHRHTGGMCPPSTGKIPGPVERARTYLQAHPTEPLALADLVELAGVTSSHLVRSFTRRVGLPPKSYHAQVRLARARRLLTEGRPATWVAYECGFADQSHLTRRFKEFYGLTPGGFQARL
jgi:AraC-like DNA-binding protein